ncbi:MAG: TlyA family rRNA (cytidine-2'-O)-methyltransferase [Vicinamibacterales bacterium]
MTISRQWTTTAFGADVLRCTRSHGDGIAILAGDALQGEAFALMAREPRTEDPIITTRKVDAIRIVATAAAATGMVGGQVVDLQAAGQVEEHRLTLTGDQLRAMHLQKTGALIRASATAGAIMAGADADRVNAIDRWATEIGLAFQIVDDILDVEGDAAALGKTAGKDAASDKPTYTSLFGLEGARTMAAECAMRAHGVLVDAELTDSWLDAIADWVISRRKLIDPTLRAVVMAIARKRLDLVLVERGLVASRERARAVILAGQVRVDGQVVSKAGTAVADSAQVELETPDHPYVGRGGLKLAHALDTFGIDVRDRRGLDIGASTGGFTDVLLQRGARDVIALDVGHNQLDWKLRSDPRVIVREGVNARALTPADLPHPVDIVTIDVAFISLAHILPVVPALLAPGADVVALVKPQFEAGRDEVGKGGIVSDPAVHEAVVARVTADAERLGFERRGLTPSPITGATGNREFLMHLRLRAGATAADAADRLR